jgi:hypothetical protein
MSDQHIEWTKATPTRQVVFPHLSHVTAKHSLTGVDSSILYIKGPAFPSAPAWGAAHNNLRDLL